jgi:hypothetical protein
MSILRFMNYRRMCWLSFVQCGEGGGPSGIPSRSARAISVGHFGTPPIGDFLERLGSVCKNSDLVRYRLIAPDDNVPWPDPDRRWPELDSDARETWSADSVIRGGISGFDLNIAV